MKIGSGGMAAVYSALDQVSSRQVALKVLNQKASKSAHLSSMFEREFHTLAHLAHPRIIEVYEFGVDPHGAYYTMELLDGADIKKLAPLNWKDACVLLRDVASSLALLHSRRLLYRDISTRNVRCTKDGRAKLIDFGAMVPIGVAAKLIGTPAFVAPEAINSQPLDQRTDLYALGALAYWLITGRYAYRAHELYQLHEAWRTAPSALSQLAPETPRALSDLIMLLINLDRAARPSNAFDIVMILGACAGLQPDNTVEIKQAYLTTPQLTGRDAIVSEVGTGLQNLMAGQGGETFLFRGPAGVGRSRVLEEFALQAQVVGATVLVARGGAGARGVYGVVGDLLEQLCEKVYSSASSALRPYQENLAYIFPEIREWIADGKRSQAGESTDLEKGVIKRSNITTTAAASCQSKKEAKTCSVQAEPVGDQHRRALHQQVILQTFLTVSQSHCLVVAVDDIHLADEPSLAFLSTLALQSRESNFTLAVTAESGAIPAGEAYDVIARNAKCIEVQALELKAVERLLSSIFGETQNVYLLADRIYGISKGNPRAVMQLAQHLVDHDTVTYQSGAWILPTRFESEDLPDNLSEALKANLSKISEDAVDFARTVALSADQRFSFQECLALCESKKAARLIQLLHELTESDLVSTDGQYFRLSQPSWIGLLHERPNQTTTRSAHARLAAVFERRGDQPLRVIQHLFGACQDERAIDLLIDYIGSRLVTPKSQAFNEYLQSQPRAWGETFRYALEVAVRTERPQKEIYLLRRTYVQSRFETVEINKTLIAKIIDQLYRDSGLDIYDDLSDISDSQTRLWRALELAQQRFDTASERERVLAPAEAIRELAEAIVDVIALSVFTFDHPLVTSLPSVQPLVALSPALTMVENDIIAIRCIIEGRYEEARRIMIEMLSQVGNSGLSEGYSKFLRLNWSYGIGLIEAAMGIEYALERADEIETDPLLVVNAWRIRAIYYLGQGDLSTAEQCKKKLELLRIQNSPRPFNESGQLVGEILAYTVADDLSGLARILNEVENLAARYKGWIPIEHYVKGEYLRLSGDMSGALAELEKALSLTYPGTHSIRPRVVGAQLRVLIELDRLQEAATLGFDFIQFTGKETFDIASAFVRATLAGVEAKLGHAQSAHALIETVVEKVKSRGVTGVFLGVIYEIRARVAIDLDDVKQFRIYAELCAEQYLNKDNPALTSKYQKLMQDARYAFLGSDIL